MYPQLQNLQYQSSGRFFLIAGPCVVEDEKTVMSIAETVSGICRRHSVPLIFKASYRKANRTRFDSFIGIGDEIALNILRKVKDEFRVPVLTDIHESGEAMFAADYVDVLQIPAFLCRQTSLLLAAARTGKCVNVKKGQFVSPQSMRFAVDKLCQAGNNNIILTERGTVFGYSDLVVDFRGIPVMQENKVPVVLDATHSLQQPNSGEGVSGGLPHLIETLSRAGIAAGADGLFIETHPDPSRAMSDGANMLPLSKLEELIERLVRIREALSVTA